MSKIGSTTIIGGKTYVYIDEFTLKIKDSTDNNLLLTELSGNTLINEIQSINNNNNTVPIGGATSTKQDNIIEVLNNINTNFTIRIIEEGIYTYIGEAVIGSSDGVAVWRVKRIDETSGMIILWADGNDDFDNIINDYLTLTYL